MRLASRDSLLQQLDDVVATGSTGRGRVLVLSGEAGIGKTTLARALAERRTGERVLWGACEPMAAARPMLPLHDFGRSLGGELAEILQGDDPRRAFPLLLDVLGTRPTLAVLEDAHWADDATLDLVVFLARRIADLPVTLVLTARSDDPVAGPRVAEVLRHVVSLPHGQLVDVAPLTLAEVGALTAGRGLDAAHVHAMTGGNAYFVTEVAALGAERVPRTVQEAVLSRTDVLPTGAHAIVECISVIPDRAEIELVYAASGYTADDLDLAERAGLLVSDGRSVAFRHELARIAVAESLTGARRRELHRRVAVELLRRPAPPESQLAFHADLAGDHGPAVTYGRAAAAQSTSLGAHHEACVQLERVRSHLGHVDPAVAGEVLGDLALVLHRVVRFEEALEASTAAYDVWSAMGDADRRARQLAHNARLLWNLGRPEETARVLDQAVRLGKSAPGSAGQLAAITQQAVLLMLRREVGSAVAVGETAAELARQRGDLAQEAIALNAVGSAQWFCDAERAEPTLTRAVELAEEVGDEAQVATILVNLGSGAAEVRRYAQARPWLDACEAWCTKRDIDLTGDYARAWQARVALELGEWDRVVGLAEPLLESRSLIGRMGAFTVLARLAVRRGDHLGRRLLDSAWALAEPTGDLQRIWPVAAGYAELGILGPARTAYPLAVAVDHAWGIGELGWWLVRAGLLSPADPVLARAAAPFAAQFAGRFSDAADLWHELGCPYEAALADAETAEPARLAEAVRTLHHLGARSEADRVAALLRGFDPTLVPRRPRRTTAADPQGLTTREVEVLALVREGLTNAEIAARMFISAKTAGHHVSAILAKLGVSSRKEAARLPAPGTPPEYGAPRPM